MRVKEIVIVFLMIVICAVFINFSSAVPSSVQILPPACSNDIDVIYTEFSGSVLTTDFDALNDCQLENIFDMALENDVAGLIEWLAVVNLREEAIADVVDLDSNVEIANNLVTIDSSELNNLIFEVRITFYSIPGLITPGIQRNGVACNAPECMILSYDSGTGELVMTTTSLVDFEASTYIVVETHSEDDGGGGGGGGSGSSKKKFANFTVDKELMSVEVKQGGSVGDVFRIDNNGDVDLNLTLEEIGIASFTDLSAYELSLSTGAFRTLAASFSASQNKPAGIYTGNIFIDALEYDDLNKSINVIIKVLELNPLFDLSTELADITLTEFQDLDVTISMIELGGVNDFEVFLEYSIKDFEDNEIKIGWEMLSVLGSLDIERKFELPEDLVPGQQYVFVTKLTSEESVASASSTFTFVEFFTYLNILIGLLILGVLFIIVYFVAMYFDRDIQRIRSLINKGTKWLVVGNVGAARKNYEKIRGIYATLLTVQRGFVRTACLKYHLKIKNNILSKNVSYPDFMKKNSGLYKKTLPKLEKI